ncbi:hypothetical protein KC19_3G066600 [Ceratodon purpureus]|uniref:Serine/threonine-protein phosphatase 4 regulatory subunit 2 n=1 Tax=Ceratodon purpureus TaxID=3225 RepID=A0A8T0IFN2_CERPU|nr:hypothetical protein KC19_3G066600 [Ceratodon purpureus]
MEVFRDLPSSAELSAFCKRDESKREFTDELRGILEVSAMTGLYWHRWDELRALLLFRLKQVLQDFYKSHMDVAVGPPRPLVTGESYQELEGRLSSGLESFTDGAPFTLQRFCEVLLNPRDRYPNLDKVALAFEKLLLVTSTIPPSPGPYPGVPSVPAPESALPAPVPAEGTDQNLPASPKAENADSTPDIMSESVDVAVHTDNNIEEPTVSVAADEEMADVEGTESKEQTMEVDVPRPSEATAAGVVLKEYTEEVSASEQEQPPVDKANTSAAPTASETSVPMEDENESKPDVMASST